MLGEQGLARLVREQAGWCVVLGSPLYGTLLLSAADDVAAGGVCWRVLHGHEETAGDKRGAAIALRFMAAVHRLVLEGRAEALARHYPSVGGKPGSFDDLWRAFHAEVEANEDAVRELVGRQCQTNVVGRSAALLGGFLAVAAETGLPLRILEVGASAGLNLRWDHYRYEAGTWSWGDPHSPVRFTDVYDAPPPFDLTVHVTERAGCDLNPIDPLSENGALALKSFVWADQVDRIGSLEAAFEVAGSVPATIDRADAVMWLTDRLAVPSEDAATVVFHSVVMDQLPVTARAAVLATIEDAGRRAAPDAPLAWLRMEGGYSYALLRSLPHEVWLTTWPGGNERILAITGAHGRPVRWVA